MRKITRAITRAPMSRPSASPPTFSSSMLEASVRICRSLREESRFHLVGREAQIEKTGPYHFPLEDRHDGAHVTLPGGRDVLSRA